ncbi:MAG: aminoglycoside phosphotransferase family protein, partial [Acidobacteria bacterium]|nr:aminoglycoside phosphotransferase family protein [Acidobacteriota bacterium]
MMKPAATKKLLLAPDAMVPQRDVLLDADSMASRISSAAAKHRLPKIDSCKIARVKYRFGTSLRVLYDVRFGGQAVKIAARTFSPYRLTEIRQPQISAEENLNRFPDFVDETLGAAFWIFPNDKKIANLGTFKDIPDGLADISNRNWKTSRIAAYAPEKCATAECLDANGETIAYAKVFAGEEGCRVFEIYRALTRLDDAIPRVLNYSRPHKMLLLEAVPGVRVADMKDNSNEVYERLGAAIALFHRIPPPANLGRANRLDPQRMPHALQTIITARPDVAFQAARLVEKLSSFSHAQGPTVSLHGDVHAKNAIWNDGKLTLIDLDQASAGDASADIGSFLAGLHYRECVGEISAKTRSV